jgi:siroheme synthase (precorrin-2 oxidase/ferrochelatase)
MFLDLVQRPVLVVGGGAVALRKTRGLVESAARVTVVSPQFAAGFDAIQDIERIDAPYAATHMARKPWRLVFAATNDKDVNALVQKHAEAAGILCCRCDDVEEGDFSSGATERLAADRKSDGRGVNAVANLGGVTLVVSTCGASPALSARICRQAAAAIDPVLPRLANLLNEWRSIAKVQVPDPAMRRALLQRLASEEMEHVLREQGDAAAVKLFERLLQAAKSGTLNAAPSAPANGAPGGIQIEGTARAFASRAVEHAE